MSKLNKYELITLTAGDCAENHAKMEQIGEKYECISIGEMALKGKGAPVLIYKLTQKKSR